MSDPHPDAAAHRGLGIAYHTLLESLEEGVVVQDAAGVVHFANATARRLLVLEEPLPSEVRLPWVGGDLSARSQTGMPIRDLFDTARPIESRVLGLRRPGAPRRWLSISATPLWPDRDGAPTLRRRGADTGAAPAAAVVTLRDVTATRRDRRRLARQARFRSGLIRLIEGSLQGSLDAGFYQRVLDAAVEVIPGAQAGSLALRDADDRFEFRAAVGYDLELLRRTRLREVEPANDRSITRPALERPGAPTRFEAEDPQALQAAGPGTRAVVRLSVPVVLSGRSLAVLSLDNFDHASAFEGEAVDMARIFATLVGALWQRFQLERDLRSERAQLEFHAFHDALTGLPNRALLHDRVQQAMAQALRSGRPVALMFVDLDEFKQVNDALGHMVGDQLLRQVAGRLRDHLREADTVARWGGDEFVLLLTELRATEDAGRVAEKILALLAEPFLIAGRALHTSVTIGLDVFPHQATTPEDLIRHADMALYRGKLQGKNRALYFTADMNEQLAERLAVEQALRGALDRDEFVLHYQPRVELDTLRVTGVEALLRWHRPEHGLVGPGEVIPVAEQTGLINDIGRVVLDKACAQLRAWEDVGIRTRVAVNLSTVQLAGVDLADIVSDALARHGVRPEALELEITESAVMRDVDASVRTLRRLQAMGVGVSLDDFGTAYSSMAYLTRLAPSAIKIDRSFVRALRDDPSRTPTEANIVRAVIALGRSLSCTLVAEGVETRAQHGFLEASGCHEAQGFLFSRPLPPALVTAVLRDERLEPATAEA